MARVFGEIPGVAVGTVFVNRQALHEAGVHLPPIAGISGSESEGADSVVVSGGYEDDEDYGDYIIYTGHGGNDPGTKAQVADQELARGNLALARNALEGLPVRVIRGAGGDPTHSPASGFRYDGLYFVEDYWSEVGRSGFTVWRFKLVAEPESAITTVPEENAGGGPAPRIKTSIQRLVRNTAMTQAIKNMYQHTCQICGVRIETSAGPYAEGAHIRPLGRPHDGPDAAANVLCLCPNDHIRFDRGAIVILDDGSVRDVLTGEVVNQLRVESGHSVGQEYLQYHRELTAE